MHYGESCENCASANVCENYGMGWCKEYIQAKGLCWTCGGVITIDEKAYNLEGNEVFCQECAYEKLEDCSF